MIKITNYTLFNSFENKKKYEIVLDEKGNETGFKVKGLLTTFDVINENGQIFKANSYDKFINEYFIKNSINIPLDIMHERGIEYLAGVVETLEQTSSGVSLTAYIPKGVYYYNLIKLLIDNGILQGFSNYGYSKDYDISGENFIVKDFSLISVSLVDVPGDATALFSTEIKNTKFVGFNSVTQKKNDDFDVLSLYS